MSSKKKLRLGKAFRYEIRIQPTDNQAFMVQVGCKTFVFETKQGLLGALNSYLTTPDKLEQELADSDKEPADILTLHQVDPDAPRLDAAGRRHYPPWIGAVHSTEE